MENRSGREALRGAEAQTLDLIAELLTSEEWAELLRGPLYLAAGQGNRDLAQRLVEAGAQIGNALHAAVHGGHGEVADDLLGNGASIDARNLAGRTPLHLAARVDKPEMVELLMTRGADKDARDPGEMTPLHIAASRGHATSALALLAGGADVHLGCRMVGGSVAQAAAQAGHLDILRAAIEHGADVDAATCDDLQISTALHSAAHFNQAGAIDVLVEAGANIEARTSNGHTPLHSASLRSNLEALTALLKHGAHVNAQTISLQTPLDFAVRKAGTRGAAEVVDVLLRSGADETLTGGPTRAYYVAIDIEEENRLAEDVERVNLLLANAPADRSWRRRGYLVLCRARPDRVQPFQDSGSAHSSTASGTCSVARTGMSGCLENVGGSTRDERAGGEWASVVARVPRLRQEEVFRTIVMYL